jgi:hypothetical protein
MQWKSWMRRQTNGWSRTIAAAMLAGLGLAVANPAPAAAGHSAQASSVQGTAPATASSRFAGTVTAVAGNVLTVKDDKGVEAKITVQDSAKILQLPAGSRNLATAKAIAVGDIAVGDRILAKTAPADGGGFTASTVLAMKQSDIAQMQQRDREDWQKRGINGLVKSVDPAAGTITVSTGNGASAKTVEVQTSKTTAVRRYAPDSTKFDDAKAATLDQIKAGDQIRAKGDKSADGTQLTADAVVAGTFRNIAGTVVSVDAGASTVTVNDLTTKKPIVVSINADSQLHKLSPMMAQGIAARLKGRSTGAPGPGGAPEASGASGSQGGSGGAAHASSGTPPRPGEEAGGAGAGGARSGNLQQMLNRAPTVQLTDLKAGDAVMVLTTEGAASGGAATAITLLAGVEPLLQASPGASQSVLSASWSLGGSAPGQDAQ